MSEKTSLNEGQPSFESPQKKIHVNKLVLLGDVFVGKTSISLRFRFYLNTLKLFRPFICLFYPFLPTLLLFPFFSSRSSSSPFLFRPPFLFFFPPLSYTPPAFVLPYFLTSWISPPLLPNPFRSIFIYPALLFFFFS